MKKPPAERPPRARKRANRRRTASYSVPMKVRMAYLAGMGRSGRQIADEVGVEDPQRIRAALRAMGLKLLREPGAMELIMVRVPRPVAVSAAELADRAEITLEDFAARVLALMCLEERVMLQNLMDPGQAE